MATSARRSSFTGSMGEGLRSEALMNEGPVIDHRPIISIFSRSVRDQALLITATWAEIEPSISAKFLPSVNFAFQSYGLRQSVPRWLRRRTLKRPHRRRRL